MTKLLVAIFLVSLFGVILLLTMSQKSLNFKEALDNTTEMENIDEGNIKEPDELTIDNLRKKKLQRSTVVIEQTLTPGSNYNRYIASYTSEGLKIYALLTIPYGTKPNSGWPVVIFNHGYIPPAQYKTTEKYIAYTDAFSKSGYIVFRSDYRGHGNSEGVAGGGYGTNDYTIDILNAVEAIKEFPQADNKRIGMWGHSMGGHITLRSMVVSKDIKAGVIWAGVVGSYSDLLNNWRRSSSQTPFPVPSGARRWRQALVEKYGTPGQNPQFWDSISATSYLSDISGPLQLHHGTADASVPIEFSASLEQKMKSSDKMVEFYVYQNDDHNLSKNFTQAINRSVEFFNKYLKKD